MGKIISITGDLGSGKSTVSDVLKERLNYDYLYTGKIQREIANRYKMTTMELNKYAETHPEIDAEIDATFRSLNQSTNLIVDSRLAWFFIPQSFKVFLKTNLIISINRISGDKQRINEKYLSKEEASKNITARKLSENKRYIELYGANCADLSNFNLIIDTSFITPERVAEIILAEYNLWLISGKCFKSFISPENLYPIRSVCDLENDVFQTIQNNMETIGYDLDFPVHIVHVNSFDYILDGHKRTSCAIRNHIDLIPAVYKDDIISSPVKPSLFYDWENFNSFKYLIYPI
jgi:cytidylate kinase